MATVSLQDTWTRLWRRRDPRARETLIKHYGYLVKITAGRIASGAPRCLEICDLLSAGMIGLIRAVDQYDPMRRVKFETYAIALIRGAILELMRGEDWAPRSARDRIKQLERAYAAVETRLGRPGTEDEVAAELGIDVDTLHAHLAEAGRASVQSLDDLLFGSEEGALRLQDTLPDTRSDTEGAVEAAYRRRALIAAVERLPERERLVLSLYYYEGLTFKEIGRVLEVSESRAFQLQQQAMVRLRGYLTADRELFIS
jgi:RNA polymerase sigma factor for flagellar operon FliA